MTATSTPHARTARTATTGRPETATSPSNSSGRQRPPPWRPPASSAAATRTRSTGRRGRHAPRAGHGLDARRRGDRRGREGQRPDALQRRGGRRRHRSRGRHRRRPGRRHDARREGAARCDERRGAGRAGQDVRPGPVLLHAQDRRARRPPCPPSTRRRRSATIIAAVAKALGRQTARPDRRGPRPAPAHAPRGSRSAPPAHASDSCRTATSPARSWRPPRTMDTGVDLLLGTGGTPEGVIAAAALRCLGGEIFARLAPRDDEERIGGARPGLRPRPDPDHQGSVRRRGRLLRRDRRDRRRAAARACGSAPGA